MSFWVIALFGSSGCVSISKKNLKMNRTVGFCSLHPSVDNRA